MSRKLSKTLLPKDRTISDLGTLRQELTKVRCWISGYEAHGFPHGVPGSQSVGMAITLIDDLFDDLKAGLAP